MDPKDRKKIQFSVPAPPSQLDPRAVEMIRRRRPTPAMLFQLSEHSSPASPHTSGEGCLLKPKRTNPCAYTPPSLKGTVPKGQSHLESGLAGGDSSDGEPDDGDPELARGCDPDSALESGKKDGDMGTKAAAAWGTSGHGTGCCQPPWGDRAAVSPALSWSHADASWFPWLCCLWGGRHASSAPAHLCHPEKPWGARPEPSGASSLPPSYTRGKVMGTPQGGEQRGWEHCGDWSGNGPGMVPLWCL
uniref:Protein phosphatase 1 regulatory subunit 1B n=1 Tax=Phasianus colchicus TaxID=9054 RepID=A0A669PX54_PHACC